MQTSNTDNKEITKIINGDDNVIELESKKKIKKEEIKEKCMICLDMVGKKNRSTTKCGHTFCLTCLHEHLKTKHTCPCCRSKILNKKPKKTPVKLTKKIGIKMVSEELRHYDFSSFIEQIHSFPNTSRFRAKVFLEDYGLELVKQMMAFQINGDDGSWDDEDLDNMDYNESEDSDDSDDGELLLSDEG